MVYRKCYKLPNRESWQTSRSLAHVLTVMFALANFSDEVQSDEVRPVIVDRHANAASNEDFEPLYRATSEELRIWIEQLGSPEFRIREKAVQQLTRCDASAVESLRKAAEISTDQEVKSRCIAIAEAIYESDVGKRSSAFLKDPDPTKTFGFEGWIPFSKIIGNGRLSKRLFAELIETNPDLAESRDENRKDLALSAQREAAEMLNKFRTGQSIELGDSVSLLYRSIQSEGDVSASVDEITLLLLRTAPFTLEIGRPPMRTLLQKLTGKWMQVTRCEPIAALIVAIDNDIPESIEIARRVISDRNCEPNLFVAATAALMRFGTKADIALLEPWQSEQRFVQKEIRVAVQSQNPIQGANPNDNPSQLELGPRLMARPPTDIQIHELRYQDLALAASAHLAGREDIRELFPRLQTHPNYVFKPDSLAFPQGDTQGRQRVIDALSRQ